MPSAFAYKALHICVVSKRSPPSTFWAAQIDENYRAICRGYMDDGQVESISYPPVLLESELHYDENDVSDWFFTSFAAIINLNLIQKITVTRNICHATFLQETNVQNNTRVVRTFSSIMLVRGRRSCFLCSTLNSLSQTSTQTLDSVLFSNWTVNLCGISVGFTPLWARNFVIIRCAVDGCTCHADFVSDTGKLFWGAQVAVLPIPNTSPKYPKSYYLIPSNWHS